MQLAGVLSLRGAQTALLTTLLVMSGALQATDAPQNPPHTAQYPNYPSETPAKFTPTRAGFEYERRVVDIPMRDGVKLHTVILIPKGVTHAGILLTRTPYDADSMTSQSALSDSPGADAAGLRQRHRRDRRGRYIRVVQDVRGKYGSEGDYVMNRPVHGPQNPTPVDDATDTYDTIDWLVKHVPESNGKVGMLGISYDGFEPLMALVHPHPALKVSVPMNPMVDGWMGDDWFHHGAFRQQNMPLHLRAGSQPRQQRQVADSYHDDYDLYMHYGSAGATGQGLRHGPAGLLEQARWPIRPTTPSGATRRWTGCWPGSR